MTFLGDSIKYLPNNMYHLSLKFMAAKNTILNLLYVI